MTHKKPLIIAFILAAVGIIAFAQPSRAEDGATAAPNPSGTATGSANEKEMQQRVNKEREQLNTKIKAVENDRKESLSAKRLETCQQRQDHINDLVKKSEEQSKKQLAVFQKIQKRVEEFYANKKLQSADYAAADAAANDKQAAAIAAIDTSAEVTFDCQKTDGANPGNIVKATITARHDALKEYRTAVKDLILVVKKSIGTTNQEKSTNTTKPATETN